MIKTDSPYKMKNYFYVKRSLLFFTVVFFFVAITACNWNSPSKIAKKFLIEIDKRNYEEAKKYCTQETAVMLDMIDGLSKLSHQDTEVKHSFTIVDEKIEGESATVTYTESSKSDKDVLHLKMINGKWLVDVSKSELSAKDKKYSGSSPDVLLQDSVSAEVIPDSIPN